MPSQSEIRESITNQIVAALKSGQTPPWRKPWVDHPNGGLPTNVVSNKRYRGINVLLLQLHQMRFALSSKFYGTFNQWKALGAQVRARTSNVPPGQWGCQVIYFNRITKTERNAKGEEIEIEYPLLRTYSVFSVDQVEGPHLDRFRVGEVSVNDGFIGFAPAEEAIAATGADIRLGGENAFYHQPASDSHGDFICCPEKHRFSEEKEFYASLLHELAHWSQVRLDWNGTYPEAELRAEIAACFGLAELGVPQSDDLSNHTAYLASWLQSMENDPKFIFRASSDASKAVDFLLSFSRQEAAQPEAALVE